LQNEEKRKKRRAMFIASSLFSEFIRGVNEVNVLFFFFPSFFPSSSSVREHDLKKEEKETKANLLSIIFFSLLDHDQDGRMIERISSPLFSLPLEPRYEAQI